MNLKTPNEDINQEPDSVSKNTSRNDQKFDPSIQSNLSSEEIDRFIRKKQKKTKNHILF